MKRIAILLICVLALFAVNSVFSAEQPEMSVFVADINAGEIAQVQVTLPENATGNVTVTVNDHDFNGTVTDGKANVELKNLKAGEYKIKVRYNGDENYSNITKEVSLTVNATNPQDNNSSSNASGEPSNTTPVEKDTNKTPANASGNPTNNVPIIINNSTNVTNNTNITNITNITNNNITNNTNVTNNTNNVVVNQPPKNPPKPNTKPVDTKNTGLPIMLLLLVVVAVIIVVVFKRK